MRASLEETFYNVDVTPAEMWRAVGEELARARREKRWKPTDVERAGGPSYKTVQTIEAGDAGTVESLDKCARALGLSIVDILHSVLASTVTPLSPEAAQVVRTFTETTVAGRQAFLTLSVALQPTAAAPPEIGPRQGGAAAPATPRPPRPGPQAVGRRKVR